jgi:hypothetical protein
MRVGGQLLSSTEFGAVRGWYWEAEMGAGVVQLVPALPNCHA